MHYPVPVILSYDVRTIPVSFLSRVNYMDYIPNRSHTLTQDSM